METPAGAKHGLSGPSLLGCGSGSRRGCSIAGTGSGGAGVKQSPCSIHSAQEAALGQTDVLGLWLSWTLFDRG